MFPRNGYLSVLAEVTIRAGLHWLLVIHKELDQQLRPHPIPLLYIIIIVILIDLYYKCIKLSFFRTEAHPNQILKWSFKSDLLMNYENCID
jgi:hypothetical protein